MILAKYSNWYGKLNPNTHIAAIPPKSFSSASRFLIRQPRPTTLNRCRAQVHFLSSAAASSSSQSQHHRLCAAAAQERTPSSDQASTALAVITAGKGTTLRGGFEVQCVICHSSYHPRARARADAPSPLGPPKLTSKEKENHKQS